NGNESVNPLVRLAKAENAVTKEKVSKIFLVDCIAFETESEKSDVSATMITWALSAMSDRMAEMSSVSALEPLKILESESEMVGLSVSPLSPVKILLVTSERGGGSERNFAASLLMLSEIDESRSSDVGLTRVTSRATDSATG